MRVHKYRVWSAYMEEMYYPGYEGDEAMVCYEFGESPHLILEVLMPPGAYIEGGEVIERDEEYQVDDTAVFMQYTGLKDKNGKEIYEGDIVKSYPWPDDTIQEIHTRVVMWNPGDSRNGDLQPNGFYLLYGFCGGAPADVKNYGKIDTLDNLFVEVIGNIFENTELLK